VSERKPASIRRHIFVCFPGREFLINSQSLESAAESCEAKFATEHVALLWDQSSVRQTETSRKEGRYVVWTSFQYQGFGKVRAVQLHAYKKLQAWQRVQKLCNL
jgi:hypothetical protein